MTEPMASAPATAPAVPPAPSRHALRFLEGSGEMARLIRAFEWSATALGAPEHWPPALASMVRMLLTTRHPGMIFWGDEHLCLYNDAVRGMLDTSRHPSLLGRPAASAWASIWPVIGPDVEHVMRGGGATWHRNEPIALPRNGVLVDTYWTSSYAPIDGDTRPNGIGGVLLLCTETPEGVVLRRSLELETALRQSEERFCMAVDSIGLGTFDIGLTTGEALLSDNARQLFGLVEPVTSFEQLLCRVHPDDRGLLESSMSDALLVANHGLYRLKLRIVAGANDIRHVSLAGKVAATQDRSAGGRTMGIVWDVTEHQVLVETLHSADQRKDEFLATLAHELRNPLAALRSASYLMGRPGVSPERTRWCSDVIQRQSKAMALLLDDLMEVSRITRGKVELKRARVELQAVVDAALETVRPTLDARGHRLEVQLPAVPVVFDADPLRLAQVLSNLISNAARYSEPGSDVRLVGSADDREVRVDIVDEGIGIAPERVPTLFEMFHRGQTAASGSTSGLGVGLAVSKGLVDLHGGRLEAASPGVGQGATFSVTVPRTHDPLGKQDDAALAAPSSGQATPRVLVADDNVDAAEAIAALLRMDGYAVDVVHDGVAALEAARERQPFAAFLDIGMPGMDGYLLATQIRRQPWGARLFLVAVTGWGQGADRDRAVAAGFDLHLTKPVEFESVSVLLAKQLEAGAHEPRSPGSSS